MLSFSDAQVGEPAARPHRSTMNRGNGYPPGPQGPPGQRPSVDGATRPPMAPTQGSQSNMSRAQRFESEKQRIQESCFAKLDENGQREFSRLSLANVSPLILDRGRVLHHPSSGRRGWRVPLNAATIGITGRQQEASSHNSRCEKYRACSHPQSKRKPQWHFLNRQDLEHGRCICC